jgi:hypothetical protein
MSSSSSSTSPPAKRQKTSSKKFSSTAFSIEHGAMARILQLEQSLQSAEEEIARLQEENKRLKSVLNNNNGVADPFIAPTSPTSPTSSITAAPIFSTTRCINKVPVEVWKEHICQKFLNLTELSILRRCHTFFEKYWQNVMAQNVIRVPQGCPTVQKAMDLAVIFSERKEYTTDDPLKIRLDEGVHKIVGQYGRMNVTCNHITFVGKGTDQTTIRGGFRVENQQNVKFEELTITHDGGYGSEYGLYLRGSETNVDVLKCVVKECGSTGMHVREGATVTATQCEFMENSRHGVYCYGANTKARFNDCQMHHNGSDGLQVWEDAVVDLHGTKTDIHSNKRNGIRASERGKVNIYLPSQHNTTHDNVGEDREQDDDGFNTGGSIANINADGTFTHVTLPAPYDMSDHPEDDY